MDQRRSCSAKGAVGCCGRVRWVLWCCGWTVMLFLILYRNDVALCLGRCGAVMVLQTGL